MLLNFTGADEDVVMADVTPDPDPEYTAWCESLDRMCGRAITLGPAHDPYGTDCDLDAGHEGPHQGPHPFIEGDTMRWDGGGACAGDALPFALR
jgi:hypothetical protein